MESARAACPAATFVSSRSASAWASVSSAGTGLTLWCKRAGGNAGTGGTRSGGARPGAKVTTVEEDMNGRTSAGVDAEGAPLRGRAGPGALAVALQGGGDEGVVLDVDPGCARRDAELSGAVATVQVHPPPAAHGGDRPLGHEEHQAVRG